MNRLGLAVGLLVIGAMIWAPSQIYAQGEPLSPENGKLKGFEGLVLDGGSSWSDQGGFLRITDVNTGQEQTFLIDGTVDGTVDATAGQPAFQPELPGKSVNVDRAGTLSPGAGVAVLARRVDGKWMAEEVVVKPDQPTATPMTGIVVKSDEIKRTFTIITPDGNYRTLQQEVDAGAPDNGEMVIAFAESDFGPDVRSGPSQMGRVKGLALASDVRAILEKQVEEATSLDSELVGIDSKVKKRHVAVLINQLEKHAAIEVQQLESALDNALESDQRALVGALVKTEVAQQKIRVKVEKARKNLAASEQTLVTEETTQVPAPYADQTPEPTVNQTSEPTANQTPVPTATPTPVPTVNQTPVPAATPTPVPTVNQTPVPTATPTPTPAPTPTSEPTATPTPNSTQSAESPVESARVLASQSIDLAIARVVDDVNNDFLAHNDLRLSYLGKALASMDRAAILFDAGDDHGAIIEYEQASRNARSAYDSVGAPYHFEPTAQSVDPVPTITMVRDNLELTTALDQEVQGYIATATNKTDEALQTQWWTGSTVLDAVVFTKLTEAISDLEMVLGHINATGSEVAQAQQAIDDLLATQQYLAESQVPPAKVEILADLENRTLRPGDKRLSDLGSAFKDLEEVAEDLGQAQYAEASDSYYQAWQHALDAIS